MQLKAAEGTGNGVVNITLHKAGQGSAAHALQPFTRGPLNFPSSSSPPQSGPVWDLKYSLPDHWDLSSGGSSSKFDETWPSKSEESPGGGCGPSPVGPSPVGLGAGPDSRGVGSAIEELEDQLSKSESRESTLARYEATPTPGHTHTTA